MNVSEAINEIKILATQLFQLSEFHDFEADLKPIFVGLRRFEEKVISLQSTSELAFVVIEAGNNILKATDKTGFIYLEASRLRAFGNRLLQLVKDELDAVLQREEEANETL
jgi:hypothetical protein